MIIYGPCHQLYLWVVLAFMLGQSFYRNRQKAECGHDYGLMKAFDIDNDVTDLIRIRRLTHCGHVTRMSSHRKTKTTCHHNGT